VSRVIITGVTIQLALKPSWQYAGSRKIEDGSNMPTITRYTALLVLTALGTGCAAHPDPIIDTKGVDPEQLAEDWEECEAYTEEILIAQGVGKGAALGSVVGAATGAVSNRREVGEAAGVGAIYGGTRSGLEADREQQKVFKNCMRGRGYRVLN
jgi:hypothetical protein